MIDQSILSRAVEAFRSGKLIEAEQLCQGILAGGEISVETLHLLAMVQMQLGKRVAALAIYDRVLDLRPRFALGHFQRACLLDQLSRYADALISYDLALRLRPGFPAALYRRGITLQALGRHRDALDNYEAALCLRPNWAEVHYARGNALQELQRFRDALLSYDEAIRLSPQLVEAISNRGNVLFRLNRLDEALAAQSHAVSLRPDFAAAHANRGAVLLEQGLYQEALASHDVALNLGCNTPGAFTNRGIILHHLGRYLDALNSFARAIEGDNEYAEAHFAEALCRLLLGEFGAGLQKYEWRWQAEFLRHKNRNFNKPLWLGHADVVGRTVLLHGEQGFGDVIQFCRYVPLVVERGAHVVLEVEPPLRSLMSGLTGAAEVISSGSALPAFDFHCPLLSLPLAFATTVATIPAQTPYLRSSSAAVAAFERRLANTARPRIGLVWSGRPRKKSYPERSVPLTSLLPVLSDRATFVSLQKDLAANDHDLMNERGILDFRGFLADFHDTAALVSALDLVISIDSSVAHLAGALGKPVWVLLPFPPDWRWLLERSDCPWYSTARLFRQDETRNWDGVLAGVGQALHKLLAD